MKTNQKKEEFKRAYKKPRLRIIELAADEVLAVGCKIRVGASAPWDPASCIGNACAGEGS